MNLVWHIVKKDFRRLRVPLALWTLLLVAQFVISGRMFLPASADVEWFNRQRMLLGLFMFLAATVGYILTGALVLGDPLVGTSMFWVTRPISGGRLLVAKLGGALLFFLAWPTLITLSWLWFCGFGERDLGGAAGQMLLIQGESALIAVFLAALSNQGSRFSLWSLLFLVAVPLGMGTVAYYLPKNVPTELTGSRAMLVCVLGLVAAGVVIWRQFCGRRAAQSLGVILVASMLAMLIGLLWPWNLTRSRSKNMAQRPGMEKVGVSFGNAVVFSAGGKASVNLQFTVHDLPADLTVLYGDLTVDFHWADGQAMQRNGKLGPTNPDYTVRTLLNLPPAHFDPATEQKQKEIREEIQEHRIARGAAPVSPPPEGLSLACTMEIPPELATKFVAEPPACLAGLRLTTGRAELLLELPLKEDATRTAAGVRVRILRVEPVALSSPAGRPSHQWNATVIASHPAEMKWMQFLLVDRAHGTVFMEVAATSVSLRGVLLPIEVSRSVLRLNVPQLWRNNEWADDPDWLADSTIAAATYPPNGGFNRELKIDRLVFVPSR